MTEDDTFAALYAMTYEEALERAIKITSNLPLGTNEMIRIDVADAALKQYGWSYDKLTAEAQKRRPR